MKITIDTKEDSKEEINKVISLLQNLLNDPYSNVEDKTVKEEGMFNIFSESNAKTEELLEEEPKKNEIKEENEKKKVLKKINLN